MWVYELYDNCRKNKQLLVETIDDDNYKDIFYLLDKPIIGYQYYDLMLIKKLSTFENDNIKYIFEHYINVKNSLMKYIDVDDLSYSNEHAVIYDLKYIGFYKNDLNSFINYCIENKLSEKNYGLFLYYLILNKNKNTVHKYVDFILKNKLITGKYQLYKLLNYSTSFHKFDRYTNYSEKLLNLFYDELSKFDPEQIVNIITKIKSTSKKLDILYENNFKYIKVKTLLNFNKNLDISIYVDSIKYNKYNTNDIFLVMKNTEKIKYVYLLFKEIFKEYHPDDDSLNQLFMYNYHMYNMLLKSDDVRDNILKLFVNENINIDYINNYILNNDNRVGNKIFDKKLPLLINKMKTMQRKNKLNNLMQ